MTTDNYWAPMHQGRTESLQEIREHVEGLVKIAIELGVAQLKVGDIEITPSPHVFLDKYPTRPRVDEKLASQMREELREKMRTYSAR